jgi:hypothetical protein
MMHSLNRTKILVFGNLPYFFKKCPCHDHETEIPVNRSEGKVGS